MGRNLMDHAYLLTWALMPEAGGDHAWAAVHLGDRGPA